MLNFHGFDGCARIRSHPSLRSSSATFTPPCHHSLLQPSPRSPFSPSFLPALPFHHHSYVQFLTSSCRMAEFLPGPPLSIATNRPDRRDVRPCRRSCSALRTRRRSCHRHRLMRICTMPNRRGWKPWHPTTSAAGSQRRSRKGWNPATLTLEGIECGGRNPPPRKISCWFSWESLLIFYAILRYSTLPPFLHACSTHCYYS